MAGDWIKMRTDLFTHPKVVRIASALKADGCPDVLRVVGGMLSIWSLFDAHSVDGELEGYTFDVIDTHLRWPGFAAQMSAVGWLSDEAGYLALPRFDAHNGQSAKRRAQDADRKREVRNLSVSDEDSLRTREEKRREEEIQGEPDGSRRQADRSMPICPHAKIIEQYHDKLPELPKVRIQSESRERAMRSFWRWVLTSRKTDGQQRAKDADQALTWISQYFERARSNDFLMGRQGGGRGHEGWKCDFDFLLTERGRRHVIEKTVDA